MDKSSQGQFRVNGHDFAVIEPYLEAFFTEDDDGDALTMIWHLAIKAEGLPPAIDGGEDDRPWKLSLMSDPGRLLTTKPGEIRGLLDLAGRSGGWDAWEDDEGEPHASLCHFDMEPVYDCRWSLSAQGGRLLLKLGATTDLHYTEGWMERLPLEIETPVELAPIPFGRDTPEGECRATIVQMGLEDPFEYQLIKRVAYLRWLGSYR